ncbi:hypothetical protein SLEP1_g12361 [Rubroshorea leprosula]|uniref:Uncharacterized protein n=1 Tax=Rubroshorea leprosula TaxID=152421 RepID=A0AAV5IC99_9ROSI|nr:hypothetical protein SLEP1_g12361 [Rubroshorea leprosula]
MSLQRTPRASDHMKNRVAQKMSQQRLSASRQLLVSHCLFYNSSSSSFRYFSFITSCLSRSSSTVFSLLGKSR